MFAGIRKRLARKQLEKDCDDDDKDDLQDFVPPANYIQISQGKIQLVHQARSLENEATLLQQDRQDKAALEKRIFELEGALLRLQEQFSKSQCGSPTFEKELREQLENMNRIMKSKERKQLQTCRDHKALQTRFARQESLLHSMQQENRALVTRIRQYEHCLDDVMRKVVDAIVAEDNLREEVVMLKSRVRDLEAQNAALSASPVKGRDEGYCTMSSGQPQPSNGHLEDLPEEPEQWLLPAEPCSTEMEDWSMSQEELAVITFDDDRDQPQQHQHQQHPLQHHHLQRQNQQQQIEQHRHDWLWNSNDFINSTTVETDSIADSIAQLLQQKIVYSEDEEVTCTDFTNDFYKLVNIRSNSSRSLYSYLEGETDDEDEDDDEVDDDNDDDDDDDDDDSSLSTSQVHLRNNERISKTTVPSPTPSEAGRAQLTSCSSSESDEHSHCTTHVENDYEVIDECRPNNSQHQHSDIEIEDVQLDDTDGGVAGAAGDTTMTTIIEPLNEQKCIEQIIKTELRRPPHVLVKSKSVLEEDEPSCILRHNQRREIESTVVRSGSVNCAIAAKLVREGGGSTQIGKMQLQERLLQRPANSWRRSNGWKRVTSPVQAAATTKATTSTSKFSPKKETKSESSSPKTTMPTATSKTPPTRIPTSNKNPLQQQLSTASRLQQSQSQTPHQQHQHQQRKSKIPPPVPVRRSYAS